MDIQTVDVDFSEFNLDSVKAVRSVRLIPAQCGVDMGDGSERGEYVGQDYILGRMGRPMRRINIMYTYYPLDPEWPSRASEAHPDMEVHGQWDYPYDDYFTYGGGIGGSADSETFKQMQDIRRHGSDVTLTLTVDCKVGDEHLIKIAEDLRHYGRINIRINHECTGDWFTHNRRYSYAEVGAFFARFARILSEHAPNVKKILCAGLCLADSEKLEYEDEFKDAYKEADIWSNDSYLGLHYGWPFDVCDKGGTTYTVSNVSRYFGELRRGYERMVAITGQTDKKLVASEINTDGDITGPAVQGEAVKRFADTVEKEENSWFGGFSIYQFRDRGRLGLEVEDPNDKTNGIPQPLMSVVKEIIDRPYFSAGFDAGDEQTQKTDIPMRWGGSEDADGVELELSLERLPVFFDVTFDKEDVDKSLMLCLEGRWFHKAPGVRTIDLMPAFWNDRFEPVEPGDKPMLRLFATPEDGINPETDAEDWDVNYRTVLHALPRLHIKYEPVDMVG